MESAVIHLRSKVGGLCSFVAMGILLTALLLPCQVQGEDMCVGDCDESGTVTVDELVIGVNIALGLEEISACQAFDSDNDGTVTVDELVLAVNNALEGCAGGGEGLGERIFSILTTSTPFGVSRSMFGNSALSGSNVATEFAPGPLILVAGELDGNDVAPLALAEDAIVALKALDGSVVCMKFFAADSTGSIDCGVGTANNVTMTQASGADAPPAELTIEDGEATGPGSAVLEVTMAQVQLAPGATYADCSSAAFNPPVMTALTTATATGVKGAVTGSITGENFSCDEWTTEDGPGMLVQPQTTYSAQAGGDAVSTLRIADADL